MLRHAEEASDNLLVVSSGGGSVSHEDDISLAHFSTSRWALLEGGSGGKKCLAHSFRMSVGLVIILSFTEI